MSKQLGPGGPLEILALHIERLNTPIGEMLILTDDEDIVRAIDWYYHEPRMHLLLRRQYPASEICICKCNGRPPSLAATTLRRYFDGDLACIATLGVRTGGMASQTRIWEALRDIGADPYHVALALKAFAAGAFSYGEPTIRGVKLPSTSAPVRDAGGLSQRVIRNAR